MCASKLNKQKTFASEYNIRGVRNQFTSCGGNAVQSDLTQKGIQFRNLPPAGIS
jgi:hypothetical protein